jgi:hypothetical protein
VPSPRLRGGATAAGDSGVDAGILMEAAACPEKATNEERNDMPGIRNIARS